MNQSLTGVFTAIVTPFADNGTIDEKSYAELIQKQIKAGVSGIVPCGTTGESPTLTHEEHDHMIEMTIDLVGGRVPVVAGTGSNSTAEAVRLSQHAQKAGADVVMLVNPYYNKPTQQGLFLHFREIASSIDIPCIVYNIKGRTGVNLETDTLLKLVDTCSNVIGVKEASGDLDQMKDVIDRTPESFSVLSGDDNIALRLIELGGSGVVSVASNIVPDKMVALVEAALTGDFETAKGMDYELSILFKALFLETNPIPIKAAMAMTGLLQENYRLPMCPLSSDSHRQRIRETLVELALLEREQEAVAV
ncbi:MAG: 4-hydroxy-tetrahydrodipicolinate synthase [Proteobacteria bacterium]|nr:4-hydroxy-tetrahydrodipicolinate synthase [Pseudomonadota bacterium]